MTHSHLTGDNPGGLLPPPLADSLDWKSLGSLVVRSVVTRLPPATTTKHTSPPSKSHRFLPPLSLFLYRCLIRPVTRALGRAVSHPAGLRDGDEECRWRWKRGELKKASRMLSCVCVCVCVSRCFIKWQVGGGWSEVGKITVKPRNPLLRDFHTVPRLRVRSQPPTASAPVCV